ncbi:MAG: hypothetical protein HC913_02755 [Microscillaceae bacterium]|nr:hypothetical protein [Microscillaceae bacterium]
MEVCEGNFSAAQISQQKFTLQNAQALTFEAGKTYWLRFYLTNTKAQAGEWWLVLGNWSYITWFEASAGRLRQMGQSGHFLPLWQRAWPSHRVWIPIKLASQESQYLYVQLRQEIGFYCLRPYQVALFPWPHASETDRSRLFYQGIFLGIMLVMAIYNFLFFCQCAI